MRYVTKEYVFSVFVCSIGIFLVGCQPNQVPNNSVLSLFPSHRDIEAISDVSSVDADCISTNYPYVDVPILVTLATSDGNPISQIPISLFADWTSSDSSDSRIVKLLYDFNEDGIFDSDLEAVADGPESMFTWATSSLTGDINLVLRLNLSCQYSGELVAVGAGLFASSSFTVRSMLDTPEPMEPTVGPVEAVVDSLSVKSVRRP